jgi:hypothetical protein
MRLFAAALCLALAGCAAAPEGAYPRLLPLVPILVEAEAPAESGDAALEARAAALRARAETLRQAEF